MKKIILLLLIIAVLTICGFSQKIKIVKGKVSSKSSPCASIFEGGEFIKTKNLKGRIKVLTEQTVVFSIYNISNEDLKIAAFKLDKKDKLLEVYEANKKGKFFIKNLPEGYYLLKFGAGGGEWNCYWVKVQISNKSKNRKIEYELSLGI